MSTHAAIGFREGNIIRFVYLHSDGYLSHTGNLLTSRYNTKEAAKELVALGGLFALRERIKPKPGESHSFEKPIRDKGNGVTTAYHRDRHELLVILTIDAAKLDDDAIIRQMQESCDCNNVYLFDAEKNQWYYGGGAKFSYGGLFASKGDAQKFYPLTRIEGFRNDYFFLSNFYEKEGYSFMYNGIEFTSAESAFQAQKSPDLASAFATLNPRDAKHRGRHVSLRQDWDYVKCNIMREIVFSKFAQNLTLAKQLVATHPAILVEENTWGDTFWGCVNGHGENILGLILMDVREDLLYGDIAQLRQKHDYYMTTH